MTKSPSLQAQEDCDQDYSKLVLLALHVFTHAGKVISELRKLCRAVHTVFIVFRNAFARAHTKLRGNSSSSERRVTDKNCASVFEFQKKLSSLGPAFALPLIVLTAPAFSRQSEVGSEVHQPNIKPSGHNGARFITPLLGAAAAMAWG